MNKYLSELFLELEEHIQQGRYNIKIIDRKKFKKKFIVKGDGLLSSELGDNSLENMFIFDEYKIDEYVCDLIIYEWLLDHKDERYKDFTFILIPKGIDVDMGNVTIEELINFISPQTNKTKDV
ncbi:MAG: hypothetical protein AABY32_02565 [Nanoarchaeota archaeon]